MEEHWAVLCQASYQSIREEEWNQIYEKLKEVSKNIGVKNTDQKVAGLRTLAWRRSLKEKTSSLPKKSKSKPLTEDRLCVGGFT